MYLSVPQWEGSRGARRFCKDVIHRSGGLSGGRTAYQAHNPME